MSRPLRKAVMAALLGCNDSFGPYAALQSTTVSIKP
jgi:hypothetical protein